jgi:hypothetical protein
MPVPKHTPIPAGPVVRGMSIILFWVLISPAFWAQTSEPPSTDSEVVDYDAEDIYFRVDSAIGYLTGRARVTSGSMVLKAHRIVLNLEENTVCAFGKKDSLGAIEGRPEFSDNGQSFTQDQLCYNFATGKGLSRHAVTMEQDVVFHAERAKRQPDQSIHVRDGKFTTCDADNPHYHFHLTKAIMVPNDKVVSGPLYLKFRKIPTPLALPFGWFPLKREKQSQGILLPGYGDGGDLGFFLKDLGYYQPLGEHWDTKLLMDVYTGGSWAARLGSNYNYRYRSKGSFNLSYQRQRQGFAGTPGFGLSNNFFVRWNHNQDPRARPNSRFSASVNFGSSGNFQQNLNSTQEEYLSNTFQSSVQWTGRVPRSPFSATISARHTQNSTTGNVQLTVPSLSLNMQRTPLSQLVGLDRGRSALLDGLAVTYSSQMENVVEAPDSVFGALDWGSLDIRNGLKHKVKLSSSSSLGFISISPSFDYDQYDGFASLQTSLQVVGPDSSVVVRDTLGGFQTTSDWRVGVSASTRFYGLFNVPGSGRVKAVRHVLSPSVGLSYNPERSRLETLTDASGEEIMWNPYALGRFVPTDLREAGAVTFSLGQNLEAKVADRETGTLKKVKVLDNLSTSGSYNLVADSLKLSDIQTRAFTSLFNKVNLNLNATHSGYARDSLTGQVVDQWLVGQGGGLLRLKRLTGAVGTAFNAGQGASNPWNLRMDYNVNLTRQWAPELARDTSVVTHALAARGGLQVSRYKLDVQTGYDLARKEFTPTNLNLYVDLHCWELSFEWIPFGIRQSFSLRLNVKSALLRDLKLEARGADGKLLF